eukprot:114099_1
MSAGPKYEYLWMDGIKYKKPMKFPAPKYINVMMTWVEEQLNNAQIFPVEESKPFPKNFRRIVKTILKRLFRVYAHMYHHHIQFLVSKDCEAHLNTCFKHFIYFIKEFRLVDERELAPLADTINNMLTKDAHKGHRYKPKYSYGNNNQSSIKSSTTISNRNYSKISSQSSIKPSNKTKFNVKKVKHKYKNKKRMELHEYASATLGAGSMREAVRLPGGRSYSKSNTIGLSVGGARDVNNFRECIEHNIIPSVESITYNGLFYEYFFDTSSRKHPTEIDEIKDDGSMLFYPSYCYAESKQINFDNNKTDNKIEFFMTVGLNSNLRMTDFKRKKLNLVLVLDKSGSMSDCFDNERQKYCQ